MTVLNSGHLGGSPSSLSSSSEGSSELSRLAKATDSLTLSENWGVRPASLSFILRSFFGSEWPGRQAARHHPGCHACAAAHEAVSWGAGPAPGSGGHSLRSVPSGAALRPLPRALPVFRMLRVCRWTGARKGPRPGGRCQGGSATWPACVQRPTPWGLSGKSEPEAHFWDGPHVSERSLEPGFLMAQAHVSWAGGLCWKAGHLTTPEDVPEPGRHPQKRLLGARRGAREQWGLWGDLVRAAAP